MQVVHLKLKNWRNFRSFEAPFREVTYILGANASGKSNLLDVFRFLRDISKTAGGGLQEAVLSRGGISKLRCLHARNITEVVIDISLSESSDDEIPQWRYVLGFKGKKGKPITVTQEAVWKNGAELFCRPDENDRTDEVLLTQTKLEQIAANGEFREMADIFGSITYSHLVPQLLKYSEQLGGRLLESDPFGQSFLERIAKTPEKTRDVRLKKIAKALSSAIPHFSELRFQRDEIGHPHLATLYEHHRPGAGWQTEEQFSDGTLRLIALLWSFLENNSLLLLEEPEISLNDGVVKEIPLIIDRLQRNKKSKRQVIISSHSEALLSNPGIDGKGVLLLEPSGDGTVVRPLTDFELQILGTGLSVAEVILPKAKPESVDQLGLWQ